jgi:hypothetical protein
MLYYTLYDKGVFYSAMMTEKKTPFFNERIIYGCYIANSDINYIARINPENAKHSKDL